MNRNVPQRKRFIWLGFMLIFVLISAGVYFTQNGFSALYKSRPICKDCNVILITLDTLSANHLPCYGYTRNTSPSLCAFADQNIIFSHAYSNSTYTLPSHVSMFTGLNPNIHGVNTTNRDVLSRDLPFLPEILHNNGYTTLFELTSLDPNVPIDKVYNRGIDVVISGGDAWDRALKTFAKNVDQGKKTFLSMYTNTVHSPYLIGNEPKLYTTDTYPEIPLTTDQYNETSQSFYQKLYTAIQNALITETSPAAISIYKDALSQITNNNYNPAILDQVLLKDGTKYSDYLWGFMNYIKYTSNFDIRNPHDIDYLRALYDQRINALDEQEIAPLIHFLSSNERIKKSTVVIITSDHGEEFMEHGKIYHSTLYDSNLRIPLIFYIPGIQNPKQISTPAQLSDIAPTILDMLGILSKNQYQGSSLVGEIIGKKLPERFIAADGLSLETITIRNKQWKLHATRGSNSSFTPYELYDIVNDPDEKTNVLFYNFGMAKNFISKYLTYELLWRKTYNSVHR